MLWEILVPTEMNGVRIHAPFAHHKAWDAKVRSIAGGLTIMKVARGQWISPNGTMFKEYMIPVRIHCTAEQILDIAKMTMVHYQQEAVMYYRVADEVHILHK